VPGVEKRKAGAIYKALRGPEKRTLLVLRTESIPTGKKNLENLKTDLLRKRTQLKMEIKTKTVSERRGQMGPKG